MKKKLILGAASTFLLSSFVAVGIFASTAKSNKVEKVVADSETVTKYLAVNDANFYKADGSFAKGGTGVGELVSGRRDTFHDGRRQYNALDNFLNTMAKTGEGETGWVRSHEWIHKGGYVSFLLGGNSSCFVNIWAEPEGEPKNLPGVNIEHVQPEFYSSRGDAFDEGYQNGTNPAFELSANMALRYFHIPDEYIGRRLIVYIEDPATSYYGGITFGDLRVNQTLDEVARTLAAHKQQLKLDGELSAQNAWARDYLINTYYQKSEYSALFTAEAALDNADEGFETYDLTNWAFDGQFSNAVINFAGIVSDNDAKDWAERMPANKSDNKYVNADCSGIAEDAKYRIISNEFTLSGTGFISAKLGGGTAVMSLIDNTGTELVSSRINPATDTNILNAGFVDAGVANIMVSGARLNTMSRTYLDASAHVGKKVRIVLADERTGGNWGLAYFDEVVTKYTSVPTLKVDKIQQQFNDTPLYRGVVTDKYVGSGSTYFGLAYDFVQRYYGLMRNTSNGVSWCSVKENVDVQALIAEYATLHANVKVLVEAAMDYDFGSSATSENWYLTEANTSYTIGQTIAYVNNGGGALDSRTFNFNNKTVLGTEIAIISSIVVVAIAIFCFIKFRKKVRK